MEDRKAPKKGEAGGVAGAQVHRCRERAKYHRAGKPERWVKTRLEGKQARKRFTAALQNHGIVQGWEYAGLTNAICEPILGGSVKELKIKRDLPARANLRDHLEATELAAILFGESLAEERIESSDLFGYRECRPLCRSIGLVVADAVMTVRQMSRR